MKIDVDFDVFKALTALRQSEMDSVGDVVRRIVEPLIAGSVLPVVLDSRDDEGWTSEGVTLPNGTELRSWYKGKYYYAKIVKGQFTIDGVAYSSPSNARMAITQTGGNGWYFWKLKGSNSDEWEALGSVRDKTRAKIKDRPLCD